MLKINDEWITRSDAAIGLAARAGTSHLIQTVARVLYLSQDGSQCVPSWVDAPWISERHSLDILRRLVEGSIMHDAIVCIQAGLASAAYRPRGLAVAQTLGIVEARAAIARAGEAS